MCSWNMDSKTIKTLFMLFLSKSPSSMSSCVAALSKIGIVDQHVLLVLKKQSRKTDSNNSSQHPCVWFCSVSALSKIRYLNRHAVCPNSFILSSYGYFLQNPQFSAICSFCFLDFYMEYGLKISTKDLMAHSVSALPKEQI
jgi:hypothetical protein